MALLRTLSIAMTLFCLYGDHIHDAYSRCDLTKVLYRGENFVKFNVVKDLLITAVKLLALFIFPYNYMLVKL